MDKYMTAAEAAIIHKHEDVAVRRAGKAIKELASELLLSKMRELGLRYLQDAGHPNLSRLLWEAVLEGPRVMSEVEVAELSTLSELADGWWRPSHLEMMEFISREEWAEEYQGRPHV